MNDLKKTIILPLVGFVCLVLTNIFNVNISADTQNMISNYAVSLVSLLLVLYGIWKNHHVPTADEIKAQINNDSKLKQIMREIAQDLGLISSTTGLNLTTKQTPSTTTEKTTTTTVSPAQPIANEDLVAPTPVQTTVTETKTTTEQPSGEEK